MLDSRRSQLEKHLERLREQLGSLENALITAPQEDKTRIKQRIEDLRAEMQPFEQEYSDKATHLKSKISSLVKMQKKPEPNLSIARWSWITAVLGVIVAIIAGIPGVFNFMEKRTVSQTNTTTLPIAADSPLTVFRCQNQGEQWVTIAEKGNLVSKKPLFVWKTVKSGDRYTSEARCRVVSEKLTQVVRENGGYLSDISLQYGQVNGEVVICASKQEKCTESNMIFTLSKNDAKTPQLILSQIMDFAQNKASNSVILQTDGQMRIVN